MPSAALWQSLSGTPRRGLSPVRPAASPRSPWAPGWPPPCQRGSPDHCSLAGYARSCSSASPRGFAPSPGSQQSSYGSGLGAGLSGYGAPGVAGLGVPGSPSFLNGSTATSPFASECPLPVGRGNPGSGEAEWESSLPPGHPRVGFQLLSHEGRPWPRELHMTSPYC